MHHGDVSLELAKGLVALKERIDAANITSSKLDESINVATWNIREFGKARRTDAAIHYIAEILGQFDLVSLVELRDDLTDLGRVLPILGPSWEVVYSDWLPDAGGNSERVAFLYDKRAVTFNGLAAEVDAPRQKSGEEFTAPSSFWRAPYMCSFRSGNFDFIAIATHARWGQDLGAREGELRMLAEWIATRFATKYVEDHDLLVMGDFNVPKMGDRMFKALTSKGLTVPAPLEVLKAGDQVVRGSNVGGDARYDQILHLPTFPKNAITAGGVVDFFKNDAQIEKLFPGKGYTRQKFTFQLSDHLPIWVQVKTDIDGFRFDQIVQSGRK
jgi:hypothetical protein